MWKSYIFFIYPIFSLLARRKYPPIAINRILSNIAVISVLFLSLNNRLLFPAATSSKKQPHTFIYEGEIKSESILPEISRTTYISLSELSKIYNLSYSFKPISGKAIIRAYNNSIEFTINSDRYNFSPDNKPKRLKLPTRLIKSKFHIPVDFITSKDFSELTETETLYYPENRTFIISVRTNISTPRFYSSNGERTKILIETIDEKLIPSFKTTGAKITLEFPRGKVLEESISVQDGLVKEIKTSTPPRRRSAIIEIYLSENVRPNPSIAVKDDGSTEIIIERAQMPITDISTPVPPTSITRLSEIEEKPSYVTLVDTLTPTPTQFYSETPLDQNFMSSSPTLDKKSPQPTMPSVKSQTAIDEKKQTIRRPKIKIVLDAGHGGEDPGAIGPNGTLEKDINLSIVKELEKLFQMSEDDKDNFEILLTRNDDTFVPLVDRTNFANEKMADLFISIHCNASIMKKNTGGYEVYFLSENASDSDAIATQILVSSVVVLEKKTDKKRSKLQELLWSMIVNEFINESAELCHFTTLEIPKRIKVENRGVKQAGFYVLRGAQMPAILVECAFLSNPQEEAKLKNPRIQKQIADGLYTAIKNYLKSKKKI